MVNRKSADSVWCIDTQLAKWTRYIRWYRCCIYVPGRDLWSEGGRCYIVWSISRKWTYSWISNSFVSIKSCDSSQSYPLRPSCHVSCQENILVRYLQGLLSGLSIWEVHLSSINSLLTFSFVVSSQNIDKIPLVNCPVLVIHVSENCHFHFLLLCTWFGMWM